MNITVFVPDPFKDFKSSQVGKLKIESNYIRRFVERVEEIPCIEEASYLIIGIQRESINKQFIIPLIVFNYKYFNRFFGH